MIVFKIKIDSDKYYLNFFYKFFTSEKDVNNKYEFLLNN
jgi:hypothetical protein